jgi:hypothetical protein
MPKQRRHLELVPSPSSAGRRDESAPEWDWLSAAVLVVGLLPFLGLAWLGHWSERELGVGAAMILFAAHHLARPR